MGTAVLIMRYFFSLVVIRLILENKIKMCVCVCGGGGGAQTFPQHSKLSEELPPPPGIRARHKQNCCSWRRLASLYGPASINM